MNLKYYLNYLKNILIWKNEDYKIREINNIIFSYKIIPEDKLINNKSKISSINKNLILIKHLIK